MEKRERILVSACLLGLPCRYDGRSMPCDKVLSLAEKYELVPVCPEIYGGLPTPRGPSERVGERVVMKDGTDVTENYARGAEASLELCKIFNIKTAILKEKSPSCGCGAIYDGSFSGRLTEGNGVTSELLASHGIRVIGESRAGEIGGEDNVGRDDI